MVGTVGTRRALQIFLAEDSFTAQQAYQWGLVARCRSGGGAEGENAQIRRAAGAEPARGDRRHQVAGLSGRPSRDPAATRCRGKGDHRRHATEDFRRRGEEVTSKGK
jgi:enoyl-CoA hydratase/carnithine racemase